MCTAVGAAGLLVGCSGVTAIVMRVLCSVNSQSVHSCAPQMLHEEQLSARPWNGPRFVSFVADIVFGKKFMKVAGFCFNFALYCSVFMCMDVCLHVSVRICRPGGQERHTVGSHCVGWELSPSLGEQLVFLICEAMSPAQCAF